MISPTALSNSSATAACPACAARAALRAGVLLHSRSKPSLSCIAWMLRRAVPISSSRSTMTRLLKLPLAMPVHRLVQMSDRPDDGANGEHTHRNTECRSQSRAEQSRTPSMIFILPLSVCETLVGLLDLQFDQLVEIAPRRIHRREAYRATERRARWNLPAASESRARLHGLFGIGLPGGQRIKSARDFSSGAQICCHVVAQQLGDPLAVVAGSARAEVGPLACHNAIAHERAAEHHRVIEQPAVHLRGAAKAEPRDPRRSTGRQIHFAGRRSISEGRQAKP